MQAPRSGVYCPSVTFFDPATESLDLVAQKQYFTYLASTGLAGLVILGTNAEALLLTRSERAALISCARESVGPDYPLIAGVSGNSNIQVMEFIEDAKQAGANYALLLPASYYGKASTTAVISSFYDEIASQSPLPIIIYNFPAVCNGIDLDSELITAIAKRNPGKVAGVKLTCGSVGKVTRLAAENERSVFATFGGQSDFLLGGLSAGSAGCISAFANVFPKTISRIFELYNKGNVDEAWELHRKAAIAESPCKAGIASTKYAVAIYSAKAAGIENAEEKLRPRKPYVPAAEAEKSKIRALMEGLSEIEKSL